MKGFFICYSDCVMWASRQVQSAFIKLAKAVVGVPTTMHDPNRIGRAGNDSSRF